MSEFGKRAVLCLMAAVLLSAGAALAQTTAKIEGVVRDSDTGSPLSGVQVTIKGTRLGNVTNEDGYYFILNVPVGLRTVQIAFTGYEPLSVVDVRAAAGNTITVDGNLRAAVIGMEGITIVGEAEPLMVRDNVQTKQRMDSDMISGTPATSIEDLIVLQAGVVTDVSGNFSIRGGREGEEMMYVDGVPVKSQHEQVGAEDRGAVDTDASGVINPLVLSQDAIEEVSVITGGFQAEYGNAQSGMINIVTKEGGSEFAGRVMFKSDQAMDRSMDYGFNHLEGSIGGPVFREDITVFASGMMRGMADAFPRVSGDKGGFRGITQQFISGLNRDLSSVGVVTDGIADRSDAIDPLSVNSFADYANVTQSPDFGYGVVNENGSVSRGFSRDDGIAFRLLTQPTVVMNPADVNADGTLRSGAQPLIQIDPVTGNLWTMDSDGLATSSPEALDAAFASGVAVANPLYSGPFANPNPARLPGNWRDLYSTSLNRHYPYQN
jgi:hypothetical protein